MHYLYRTWLLFVPTVILYGQFGAKIIDENRSPIPLKQAASDKCKISVGGVALVGRQSVSGGRISIQDASGSGIRAVSGVIRFSFASGRFYDHPWRYQSLGKVVPSANVTPKEGSFGEGSSAPTKAELRILGGYFGNGELCGETGSIVKRKFDQAMESAWSDGAEAIKMSNEMAPKAFAEALRNGLLKSGPYARETVDLSNDALRRRLLGPDGQLKSDYKQQLLQWQSLFRPATLARQRPQ